LKGRSLLRIVIAAALTVILAAVLPLVLGCSQLPTNSPTTVPPRDKGVPPPLYRPGTPDQAVDIQTADQAACGGEMENPNETIAPKT
jgi:hypothetical protein